MKELLDIISDNGLGEPNEVRFGQKTEFFVDRKFTDAYEVSFDNKVEAQKFIAEISAEYFREVSNAVMLNMTCITKGFNDDFTATSSYNYFIYRRFQKWYDKVISELKKN